MVKNHGFWRLILDLILIAGTGGLWFIWILIRYLIKKEFYLYLTKEEK